MGCKHGGTDKENDPFGSQAPQETSSHAELINTIFADGSQEFTMENDSGGMDGSVHQGFVPRSYRNEDEMSSSTPRRNNHAMGLRRSGSNDHSRAPGRSRKTLPRTTEPWGDLTRASAVNPPPGFAATNEQTQTVSDEIIDAAMKLMDLTIQQDRYIRNLEKEFDYN